MREALWRAVFSEADFERFKALGHRKDFVTACIGEMKICEFGDSLELKSILAIARSFPRGHALSTLGCFVRIYLGLL